MTSDNDRSARQAAAAPDEADHAPGSDRPIRVAGIRLDSREDDPASNVCRGVLRNGMEVYPFVTTDEAGKYMRRAEIGSTLNVLVKPENGVRLRVFAVYPAAERPRVVARPHREDETR